MNIFLLGFMGAGKTSVGKILAQELNFQFIDLDQSIEADENSSISEIFSRFGESKFRELERNALNKTIKLKNTIVSTGGGTPCFFDNMQQINKNASSIYLKFSPETLASRIKLDSVNERPLAKEKNKEELILFTKDKLSEREKFYAQAQIIINEETLKPKELAHLILKELKKTQNK